MAKNRFSLLPNLQTPAMSPAHPHTVNIAVSMFNQDDEDEDDICPVCDGQCTCDNRPRVVHEATTSSNLSSFQHPGSSSSSSAFSPAPHSPPPYPPSTPLKIRLTLPPKTLGTKKLLSAPNRLKSNQETTSVFAPAGENSYTATPGTKSHPRPKPRGRPPKALTAARQTTKAQTAARLSPSSSPQISSQPYIPKNVGRNNKPNKKSGLRQKRGLPKLNRPGPKNHLKRKRPRAAAAVSDNDDETSLSDLTDIDYDCDDDGGDGESGRFPTFVSASVLSSIASDDSSSDSSDESDLQSLSFEGDSDIEKEEENFIVSEAHTKARVRRELLGNDDGRNRDPQGDWVIRPRKKSVDPSDTEMNVDSDATEDEDEDEEQDLDEDDEETDERRAGVGGSGLVTAWSDGDESSFDADIFFANLTDSDSDSDSSSCSQIHSTGDDGDYSDMDAASHSDTAELMTQRHELENLQLEVTQRWDGQIVFSNGLSDGRGILDIDFEVEASQFMADSSPLRRRDSDVEMSSTSAGTSTEEDGNEEDAGGGEGDTTDEELVDEDDLPNERAMELFSLPFNVSAIDPLSTVSPVVSPAPRRRAHTHSGSFGSPKPEDILAGKVSWDSEDHDDDDLDWRRARSGSQRSSRVSGPRRGIFVPVQETRQAIIDGSKEVPSPHPKFNRRRGHSTTTRINTVEQMLRKRLLDNTRSTPTFATASELLSPLQLLSSDDFGSPSPSLPMSAFSDEPGSLSSSINLDDVLEASFLAPESAENSDNSTRRTKDSVEGSDTLPTGTHLQNLSRWDTISVGAFRQTRENAGWNSDTLPHSPHSSVDYNNIMKASPLSALMWPKDKKERRRRRNLSLSEPMTISPVILPVPEGDVTPTGADSQQRHGFEHDLNQHMQKYRKESKRERKLKKKNWGPAHHHHSHHHQKHHSHQHHPNSRMRGAAANQRSFLTAVPPFSL